MNAHSLQHSDQDNLKFVYARHSVRAYAPKALDNATVQILLDAAVHAPTAIHEEPWAFVVVQDHDTIAELV